MHYVIRVRPALDAELAAWFQPWEVSVAPDGTSTLAGWAADQAALHGVLAKVRDLNLTLISVNSLTGDAAFYPKTQNASGDPGSGSGAPRW
jgi:hypothetical protein